MFTKTIIYLSANVTAKIDTDTVDHKKVGRQGNAHYFQRQVYKEIFCTSGFEFKFEHAIG